MNEAIEKGVANDSNVKVLERDFFQKHIEAGIISPNQEFDMMLELKYDGISVEADCYDEVISARSRGDTGIGLANDMTPILKGYKFPYAKDIAKDLGYISDEELQNVENQLEKVAALIAGMRNQRSASLNAKN